MATDDWETLIKNYLCLKCMLTKKNSIVKNQRAGEAFKENTIDQNVNDNDNSDISVQASHLTCEPDLHTGCCIIIYICLFLVY